MGKYKFNVSMILMGFLVLNCVSTTTKFYDTQAKKIPHLLDEIIASEDNKANIGILVYDLDNNRPLYQKNAHKYFVPSSSHKILTLAAALHYLGPSFRFETFLLTDSYSPKDQSIKDLFVKGSGDPGFMESNLFEMAQKLSLMGIKTIKGDILVDDEVFDDNFYIKGMMLDDMKYGFAAPVSGLNLNYNRVLLEVKPSFEVGQKAFVTLTPKNNLVTVKNGVTTASVGESPQITYHLEQSYSEDTNDISLTGPVQGLLPGDKVKVSGKIPADSSPLYRTFSVKAPSLLAGEVLASYLKALGVSFKGKIVRKPVSEQAMVLTKYVSRTLSEAVIDYNKISNNLAMDALVKAIAVQVKGAQGSFQEGLTLIKAFLEEEVDIGKNDIVAADGSGLSRYNLITPAQMVKVLAYAHKKLSLGPEFMVSLPIAGSDGTLERRMKWEETKGVVRAKSGSMSGLNSLVGYTQLGEKKLAFAIIVNGFVGSSYRYTQIQDNIVRILTGEAG